MGVMNMNRIYEPGLWKSYSSDDRIDFLVEQGCLPSQAEEYALRQFADLPRKIRESIEKLEDFDGN